MTAERSRNTTAASTERLQFSLRSALVLLSIVAVVLGCLVFYRPYSVTVNYGFATVDRSRVQAIFSSHAATPVDDSPFVWVILGNDDLAALMQQDGKAVPMLGPKHTRTVSDWPKVAETCSYSEPRTLLLDPETNFKHTDWESGGLAGFLGARRAGTQVQVRIEFDVTYDRPDYRALPAFDYPRQTCQGKLLYEGAVPRGHLVFLAPLGEESCHVVIFDFE